MKKIILMSIILAFCCVGFFSQEEAIGIIVNKGNGLSSITTNVLRNIYLGKQILWPDDKTIRVAVLKEGKIHDKFLKTIVKQNATQFNLFWQNQTFTGTGVAPTIFQTEDELKTFIRDNPGSIGYISMAAIDDTVKKLSVL